MTDITRKCPKCGKFYFISQEKGDCPFCGHKDKPRFDIFKDLFGMDNPFGAA